MPRIITGSIAMILALGWAPAWTAAHPIAGRLLLGSAIVGQAASDDSPETARQRTVDLCKRARQAMDEGKYETAESLLGRAEAMNANFGIFYFGDQPKKVRRDLERIRVARPEVKRPSTKFVPSTVTEAEKANEPAKPSLASMSGAGALMTPPAGSPGSSLTDPKGQAKTFLTKGRHELAQGNVTAATFYYRKAMQTGARFNPGEDSPAALLADLQKAGAKLTQLTDTQSMGPDNLPPAESSTKAKSGFPAQSPFNKRTVESPPSAYEARPFFAKEAPPEKFDPTAAAVLAPAQPTSVFGQSAPTAAASPTATAQTPAAQIPAAQIPAAQIPVAKTPAAQIPAARTSAAQAPTAQVPNSYPVATGEGDRRLQSDKLLLAARRALAMNDVRRATEAVAQAKAMSVRYDFTEDNPTKVEAAIYKFNELLQRPAGERNGESYRRRYAELQMQQADDLLRWREFEEAERLVGEAQRLGLNYGPFEASPEMLQKRIADARKQAAGALVEALPSVPGKTALAEAAPPPSAPPGISLAEKKSRTFGLLKKARGALAAGDLDQATKLAEEAQDLKVPDSAFSTQDDRPFLVMLQIQRARRGGGVTAPPPMIVNATDSGIIQAGAEMPIHANIPVGQGPVGQNLLYDPDNDSTKNQPANSLQPLIAQRAQSAQSIPAEGPPAPPDQGASRGMQLFLEGEEALRRHDAKTAMTLFRQAQEFRQDLDPAAQQRLQDHLQLAARANASAPGAGAESMPGKSDGSVTLLPPTDGSLMKEAAAAEQVKLRQVSADVARQEELSRKARETDPKQARAALAEARSIASKSQLSAAGRDILLRRIDRSEAELDQYVDANRGKIELNDRNDKVRKQIEHVSKNKVEVQGKMALMVDEYNKLVDEQRFDEAEVVAKRLNELAPKEPVVVQISNQARQLRRMRMNSDVKDAKERGFWTVMHNVDEAGVPFDDSNPYQMPDAKKWDQLTKTRAELMKKINGRRSEKEMEIEQRLRTPVSVRFKETPLAQVLDNLAKLAQVNLHLDPRGLAEEGVSSDTPVTIDLSQEISLKSALSLILEPLHMGYVIKDEVLKITSEQLKDGEVITKTYNVADLVIPIPNFVPNGQMGLPGALADAHRSLGIGGSNNMTSGSPMGVMANNSSPSNAALDAKILAQFNVPNPTGGMGGMGMGGNGVSSGSGQNIPFGPGGMGGGVQPDFDSLIELITGTIAPTTWSEVGGAGAIKQFATNLSLVISQTQEVHEEIADLLEQLRRLQDLQVTIEVRFLTLSDQFYEQMGIQMNLNANANAGGSIFGQPITALTGGDNQDLNGNITNPSRNFENRLLGASNAITVGMANPFSGSPAPLSIGNPASQTYSQDLGIPFAQTSFNAVQGYLAPLAGAGGIQGGGTLGFAILSDLEAYFFMQAVQDDQRSNIMQAPKVTLFNGQQAFVSDTTQSPFVITVIPVVGDFAAAQQPVIVVLSEGTFLSVQAVVSSDRRFVRLTVVPFFSSIGTVNTFTFTGSSSSSTSSSSDGPASATTQRQGEATTSSAGTTVQLPEFKFTTVTTTVSVPDGGTVLLGGIKRLTEERFENGIPILNKLPYVNRLFNNVATFRSTSSLMMMVTPRIIIQEEEEALLGVQPNQ